MIRGLPDTIGGQVDCPSTTTPRIHRVEIKTEIIWRSFPAIASADVGNESRTKGRWSSAQVADIS